MLKKYLKKIQFSKKNIAITSIILIIVSLIIFLLWLPFFTNQPEISIKKEFDSEKSLFSSTRDTKIIGGFNGMMRELKWKIVQSKFDLMKPVYTLIREGTGGKYSSIWIIKLQRDGINSFKVDSYRNGDINNKPFSEAISIAQKYDLSTTNPDPDNITVYPPKTPEQIQQAKKNQEQIKKNDQEYIDQKATIEDLLQNGEAEEIIDFLDNSYKITLMGMFGKLDFSQTEPRYIYTPENKAKYDQAIIKLEEVKKDVRNGKKLSIKELNERVLGYYKSYEPDVAS